MLHEKVEKITQMILDEVSDLHESEQVSVFRLLKLACEDEISCLTGNYEEWEDTDEHSDWGDRD